MLRGQLPEQTLNQHSTALGAALDLVYVAFRPAIGGQLAVKHLRIRQHGRKNIVQVVE